MISIVILAMRAGIAAKRCRECSPDYRRKGYAFEALSALLDLLQKELCLGIVTAGILPENLASGKLLTKLGFHKEGLRHKAVWHEGLDRPVDLIYYYRD